MPFLPDLAPTLSQNDRDAPISDIVYFERRLEATLAQAAESAEECALSSHQALAALYRSRIAELRLGQKLTTNAWRAIVKAGEPEVLRKAADRAQRPKLFLGWRRAAPQQTP